MRATLINASPTDQHAIVAGVFSGGISDGMADFFRRNVERAISSMSNFGSTIASQIRSSFEKIASSEAIDRAKRFLFSTGSIMGDVVKPLLSHREISNAAPVMRRYIMDHPVLNKKFRRGVLSGFDDKYFDTEPDVTGEWRTGYLAVMDGISEVVNDDSGEYTIVRHVSLQEDEMLDIQQQFAILDTWELAMLLLEQDIDPTKPV